MFAFSRAQQWIVAAAIAVLLAAAGCIIAARARPPESKPLLEEPTPSAPPAFALTVDVGGEVARPGVYRLPASSRTRDAITAAGGPTAQADASPLNLAAFLRDGDKVFVPRRAASAAVPAATAQPPAVPAVPRASDQAPPAVGAPISINRAGVDELQRLPGIGLIIAQRIVEYRAQHGYFMRLEDLMLVQGIGPKKLERIRPFVSL